jgi:hypothetical protein
MSEYTYSFATHQNSKSDTNIRDLNGGVVIRLNINDAYELNYYQTNYIKSIIGLGSSMSILFIVWRAL